MFVDDLVKRPSLLMYKDNLLWIIQNIYPEEQYHLPMTELKDVGIPLQSRNGAPSLIELQHKLLTKLNILSACWEVFAGYTYCCHRRWMEITITTIFIYTKYMSLSYLSWKLILLHFSFACIVFYHMLSYVMLYLKGWRTSSCSDQYTMGTPQDQNKSNMEDHRPFLKSYILKIG